ncbi:EamA family transporter [Amycolatopsis sp. CA-230715]|uniref:EamA family transporter n=1 Tax=Amycolatopsis sp. CA-230715 TaxID=2745196 RepID=UPI001C33A90A|nr:EamA family transporter [Amycolatopsis sp. CA-230715]QWF78610.1 putative inner membrane transporter YedA [Amycolatopsis sp. CA-230715]
MSSAVPVRTLVAMVSLWLCWGSSFPAIRVMVATLPPLSASGAVFLTAGIVLVAFRPRAFRELRCRHVAIAAGVGACLLGAQGMVAVASRHLFAGTAALLVAAVPLWVVLLRAVLGERCGKGAVARVVTGFAGVAVVLVADSGGRWSAWGLLVLAAAVTWAAGTVWAARAETLPPPIPAAAVQLVAGGLLLLVLGAVAGEEFTPARTESWLALADLVLVDSLAGFVLYNRLLRAAPVSLVSTYAYAVPVVAWLAGVVVLGEPFRPAVLLGAVVIVAAVAGEVRATSAKGRE